MIQRIALYATLGTLLDQGLECHWNTWQFWCVLALFWASEHLTRVEVVEDIQQEVERLKALRKDKQDD